MSANVATLKCNSHRDQISVYDSLNTFGVEAKLKCGEEVEIVGRVQDGVAGYVPEAAFADLPPAAIHSDLTHDVGLVATQVQEKEIPKAAATDVLSAPADSGHAEVSTISGSVTVAPADNTSEKTSHCSPFSPK